MSSIIGIDLGTTNSVVATADGSKAKVLDNREAKSQTRSVVGLKKRKGKTGPGSEEILVGDPALDNWLMAPKDTIISVKRLMGRAFSDPDVQKVTKSYLYEIIEPSNGTKDSVRVRMGGKEYSPIEISALILGKLKADAEFRLGHPVTHAVITVPAYFGEVQRDATRKAGLLAGLNVIKLLDEPTAAAIAFGVDSSNSDEPKTILVYDLGGGTFDISILMMAGGILAPLSLMGDMWLGGDNFDEVLVDHAVAHVRDEHGIDPATNKRFMVALKKAAKEVKERLSNALSADLIVAAILQDGEGDPVDVEMEVTRDQYNRMIAPLVAKTVVLTVKAVAKAGLLTKHLIQNAVRLVERLAGKSSDLLKELERVQAEAQVDSGDDPINHVLMAGNSTCVPAVQDAMEQLFGKEKVLRRENPKHVVALGAAMVAARVGERVVCQAPSRDDAKRECGHVNATNATVCEKCGTALHVAEAGAAGQSEEVPLPGDGGIAPFNYGVLGAGDRFTVFIKGGDPYETPKEARVPQTSETRVANQRMVRIPVYGGDHLDKASLNEKQGEALAILPAGLPRGTKVHVKIWLDGDGVFKLTAHLADGTDLRPKITRDTDLKAVEAVEKVERAFAEKAEAVSPSEIHRLDTAREQAYEKMRQGDYDGAARAAQDCAEQIDKVIPPPPPAEDNIIRFAEYVLQKYGWILKADPDYQARLENLIDEAKAEVKRKNQGAFRDKIEELAKELDNLPGLIQAFIGMKGAIATRIQPLDPATARNLDEELEELEEKLRRQVDDIERKPRSQQAAALERLMDTVRQEIEAMHGKLQEAIERAHKNRKKGVPCPNQKCDAEVPPGVIFCPKCGEDLRLLDFGAGKAPSFRSL